MHDFDKALAAGDGTLHSALDYWQERALKAETAIAQPITAVPSKDVILAALEEYRCTGHVDEDGGVLLVDMLASGGTTSVGVDEIEALADFIWGAISDAQPVQPTPPYELAAIAGRWLTTWLTLGKALHPLTINLVVRFARALSAKLADAEMKYGYSDGWKDPHWMDECRTKLMEHIAKGDPRDVAAYCMFLWHHGATTTQPVQPAPENIATAERERIARHFDERDKGIGGFYDPHEPAEIIRALGATINVAIKGAQS